MKKYVIKATALAIGALVGGGAFASIDFTAADVSASVTSVAKELNYASTTPLKAGFTNVAGLKTILGFGVSASQNRYIRVDVGGAKIGATAAAGANVTGLSGTANVVVVSGGATDDTYVIYQVTGGTTGEASSAVLTINLPDLKVTNSNASAVTVAYNLYETAGQAVNQTAGTSLYSKAGSLATFTTGYKFTVTKGEQTAGVVDAYKKFVSTGTVGPVPLGSVVYAASGAVNGNTGAAVALSDIVDTTTTVKFAGDFSFTKVDPTALAANKLFVASASNCTTGAAALNSVATDLQSASLTVGNTGATIYLCATAASNTVIPETSITADYNPVAVTGATVTDPSAVAFGTILHDGTTLQAPFTTIHPDYLSRVVLTSQHSTDVVVQFSAITEDGVTVPSINSTATLKAGKMLVVNVKDIVPALSAGTRLAIKAVIAAPSTSISGVYNVMNYDQATGKTNSLISYPLLRPGSN